MGDTGRAERGGGEGMDQHAQDRINSQQDPCRLNLRPIQEIDRRCEATAWCISASGSLSHSAPKKFLKRPLTPHAPRPRTEDDRDPDPDLAHETRDECGCVQWRDAVPEHAERLEERHAPAEELGLDGDDDGAEGDDDDDAGEEWEGLGWGCLRNRLVYLGGMPWRRAYTISLPVQDVRSQCCWNEQDGSALGNPLHALHTPPVFTRRVQPEFPSYEVDLSKSGEWTNEYGDLDPLHRINFPRERECTLCPRLFI